MFCLGLDFGGTKLTAGVVEIPEGRIVHVSRESTPGSGAQASIGAMFRMARREIEKTGVEWKQTAGVGVSFGGPVDGQCERTLMSHHESGWEGIPLRKMVEEEFGLPATMENDANAAALAEWQFGAGQGYRHVAYLTVSSGIGGGVVADGKIYRGAHGTAGEIGHTIVMPDGPSCTCGRRGCLEGLASGWSIARRAKEAMEQEEGYSSLRQYAETLRAEMIFEAAERGDALAARIIEETCRYLAIGIGNLINLFDPEVVVLGGGVSKAGDRLFIPLRRFLETEAVPVSGTVPPIVPGSLYDNGGLLGAIAVIAQCLGKKKNIDTHSF